MTFGRVGAQTVNGIELIEVGGNSAGNFALTTGTVEAKTYVYTLAKGKGNDEKIKRRINALFKSS